MRALINLLNGPEKKDSSRQTVALFEGSLLQWLEETAPPGKKAAHFIRKHRAEFKKRYGKEWASRLYGTAWHLFGKHEDK